MRVFVVDKHKKPLMPCLPARTRELLRKKKASLRDTAAVNTTRYAIGNALKTLGLPTSFLRGGRTKYNRSYQGYKKDHWIDAACVGTTGQNVDLSEIISVFKIEVKGRRSRQMCRPDWFGFPRTSAKIKKRVMGFQTGDVVKAIVLKRRKLGTHFGRVAVRSSGNFNIKTSSQTVQGVNAKYCERVHLTDEYGYSFCKEAAIPPWPKDQGLHAVI